MLINRSLPRAGMVWRLAVPLGALALSGCLPTLGLLSMFEFDTPTEYGASNLASVDTDSLHVDCLTPPDPGTCREFRVGYYYDYRADRCQSFRHGGCGGSLPFATLEACQVACGVRPDR